MCTKKSDFRFRFIVFIELEEIAVACNACEDPLGLLNLFKGGEN